MNENPKNVSAIDRRRRRGVRTVSACRLSASGDAPTREKCEVIVEDVLSVEVEGVGTYSLMWTPTESLAVAAGYTRSDGVLAERAEPEALALAAGFCFTEGLIAAMDDIQSIAICPGSPGVVRVRLLDVARAAGRRRSGLVTSSCGICGSRELIENGIAGLSAVGDTLRLSGEHLSHLMALMCKRQAVFQQTGGAHAAAIFDSGGEVVAAAEDLGRHNALDKVIGSCLLRRQPLDGCGVLLSSRLSFEMIVKAVRARFQLVAAVSAPTSLAIEVADRYGVTLCGFVREERATIYTHAGRVSDKAAGFPRRMALAK